MSVILEEAGGASVGLVGQQVFSVFEAVQKLQKTRNKTTAEFKRLRKQAREKGVSVAIFDMLANKAKNETVGRLPKALIKYVLPGLRKTLGKLETRLLNGVHVAEGTESRALLRIIRGSIRGAEYIERLPRRVGGAVVKGVKTATQELATNVTHALSRTAGVEVGEQVGESTLRRIGTRVVTGVAESGVGRAVGAGLTGLAEVTAEVPVLNLLDLGVFVGTTADEIFTAVHDANEDPNVDNLTAEQRQDFKRHFLGINRALHGGQFNPESHVGVTAIGGDRFDQRYFTGRKIWIQDRVGQMNALYSEFKTKVLHDTSPYIPITTSNWVDMHTTKIGGEGYFGIMDPAIRSYRIHQVVNDPEYTRSSNQDINQWWFTHKVKFMSNDYSQLSLETALTYVEHQISEGNIPTSILAGEEHELTATETEEANALVAFADAHKKPGSQGNPLDPSIIIDTLAKIGDVFHVLVTDSGGTKVSDITSTQLDALTSKLSNPHIIDVLRDPSNLAYVQINVRTGQTEVLSDQLVRPEEAGTRRRPIPDGGDGVTQPSTTKRRPIPDGGDFVTAPHPIVQQEHKDFIEHVTAQINSGSTPVIRSNGHMFGVVTAQPPVKPKQTEPHHQGPSRKHYISHNKHTPAKKARTHGYSAGIPQDGELFDIIPHPEANYYPEDIEVAFGASSLAYLDKAGEDDRIRYILRNISAPVVTKIEHSETDSKAVTVTGIYKGKPLLIIATRGTASVRNLLTDANTLPSFYRMNQNFPRETKVHSGFQNMALALKPQVLTILRSHLKAGVWRHSSQDTQVMFTGHSLGGAVAQLLSCDGNIVSLLRAHTRSPAKVITFGKPRVGNSVFAREYENIPVEAVRVSVCGDPVPEVPPKVLGFKHAGYARCMRQGNFTTFSDDSASLKDLHVMFPVISLGLAVRAIPKHGRDSYRGAIEAVHAARAERGTASEAHQSRVSHSLNSIEGLFRDHVNDMTAFV